MFIMEGRAGGESVCGEGLEDALKGKALIVLVQFFKRSLATPPF
jgi:hypothetical protein